MKLNKNYKRRGDQKRYAENNSHEMRAIKKRLIQERGSRCEWCNRYGDVECDHITPVENYGTDRDPYDLEGNGIAMDDDSNLQLLCKECHDEKTAQENAEHRARWLKTSEGIRYRQEVAKRGRSQKKLKVLAENRRKFSVSSDYKSIEAKRLRSEGMTFLQIAKEMKLGKNNDNKGQAHWLVNKKT